MRDFVYFFSRDFGEGFGKERPKFVEEKDLGEVGFREGGEEAEEGAEEVVDEGFEFLFFEPDLGGVGDNVENVEDLLDEAWVFYGFGFS